MTPLLGKRHSFNVLALAWSPDGGQIATAGHGHVQVWEAATGRNAVTYRGHSYYVYAVAWSPDGLNHPPRQATMGTFMSGRQLPAILS